ncbi:MAG: amidohydrolase [Gemmatimonadota bacterium]
MTADSIDTLITGARVVTMDPDARILDEGAVAVADGAIVAVGSADELRGLEAAESVDARGLLLMPGLVNAHVHTGDALFRGLVEDLPLEPWLERLWISEREFVTPENLEIGARLALLEMIRCGTTTALDMFWFPEVAATAAREAGFRLVTGPIWFDFDGPDGLTADRRAADARAWLIRWAGDPLIISCTQPHNHLTVSPEGLREARALADEFGVLFHTHCSETATEVERTRERFGCTPVEHLHGLGILDGATALAHCVHLTDRDLDLLAASGAAMLHNPLSNLKLGSGIAPVVRLLERGVPVLIGTDGPVSSNDLDMWTAMRFAGLLQRGAHRNAVITPAFEVVRMVTSAGGAGLGLGDRIGSIEPGKRADLILIDLDRPHLTPMYDVYAHLAYAVGRGDVRSVMADGRWLMRDRELLTLDEERVLRDTTALGLEIAGHARTVAAG